MKIAYIDVQFTDFHEDYAVNAKGYGGGTCLAKYSKYLWPDFTIFAQKESFQNFEEWERESSNFAELTKKQCEDLRSGAPISEVIQSISDFDAVMHHHDSFCFNKGVFDGLHLHWSLMGNRGARRGSDYTFIYNDEEDIDSGFLSVQIGKYVPEIFRENKKEGFIFQCSRHDSFMGSIELAKICIKNNIRCIFSGRIMDGYPLMEFIDNVNTFWVGAVSEGEKLDYLHRASAFALLCDWNEMPFNQSIIESLSCGTPVLTVENGFTKKIVESGKNGFLTDAEIFPEDFNKCHSINQRTCWESAHKFSHIKMIKSFQEAIKKIK